MNEQARKALDELVEKSLRATAHAMAVIDNSGLSDEEVTEAFKGLGFEVIQLAATTNKVVDLRLKNGRPSGAEDAADWIDQAISEEDHGNRH